MGNGRATGLVVARAVGVLAVLSQDLVEEALAGSQLVVPVDGAGQVGLVVAGGCRVTDDREADPVFLGGPRGQLDAVGQRVDAVRGGGVGRGVQASLGLGDLRGLDLETLGEVGLVGELAGVGGQRSVVGGDDLVVHVEARGAVGAAVRLDGLLDAQLGSLVFVHERTGDGGCLVGRCTADVLEVDAALGLGHGDVFTDAVDALDVLEAPLVLAAGRDVLLRDGEVGVADLEGDERRVVLRLGLTEAGGGQRRGRVGCGDVRGLGGSGGSRGLRDGHRAGGRRGAVGVVCPGGTRGHREVGGGDRRVGARRVLDGLRDAHGALLGDDAVEAGVVNREFLRHEVVGALGVSRRGRWAVRRRDGVEVLRGQEVGRIRRGGESPQLQAVGAAVLREGLVGDGLLQLDGVGDVGILVNVTLRTRPGARRDLFLHELVVRLLRTAVVVLAVQVVVTVTLAHVLDTVHASGARFGLVDVTLRAIRRVHRVRLIGGTDEGAGGRVTGTTVGTIEDQVTDPPSTD